MSRRKPAAAIWAGHVQSAMRQPAPPTDKSRATLEAEIAEISALLKGPMDGASRLDLVEARSIRRKQLEAISEGDKA